MLGTIIGDIVGSPYEFSVNEYQKPTNIHFNLFDMNVLITDDSILTLSVIDAILNRKSYAEKYVEYATKYPSSYGLNFIRWVSDSKHKIQPAYNSFGNGSAMRVAPVAYLFDTLEETINEAEKTALPTHNHPEGIKGAVAVAGAIFLGRKNHSKEDIRNYICSLGYNLDFDYADLRRNYKHDETCMRTVPEAMFCFILSDSFEDCIRKTAYIGGDADTTCAISGSVAEAFYKEISREMIEEVVPKLSDEFTILIKKFYNLYVRGCFKL